MTTKAIILEIFKYDSDGNRISIDSSSETVTETKAQITTETDKNEDNSIVKYFYMYKVRIPLIHGYNALDSYTPDDQITTVASACVLPHTHGSLYSVGDVVYVTMEDLLFDNPLILGMAPNILIENLSGSIQTDSTVAFDKVSDMITTPESKMVLPYDILVRAVKDTQLYELEKFTDSVETPYVTGENISYVRGADAPIQGLINSINSTFTKTFSNYTNVEVKCVLPTDKSITVNQQTWTTNGEFPGVNQLYAFNYNAQTDKYLSSIFPSKTYDKSTIKSKLGIDVGSKWGVQTIIIHVKSGPIQIKMGGTSATNAADARANLGITGSQIISSQDFQSKQTSDLEPNTVYYIY